MSIITTVIAIALGTVPVNADGTVQPVGASGIGRYVQTVDRAGNTRVSGFTRTGGHRFVITVEADGDVKGVVGDQEISFRVAPLS